MLDVEDDFQLHLSKITSRKLHGQTSAPVLLKSILHRKS